MPLTMTRVPSLYLVVRGSVAAKTGEMLSGDATVRGGPRADLWEETTTGGRGGAPDPELVHSTSNDPEPAVVRAPHSTVVAATAKGSSDQVSP